jgi:hypothetical protein
MPNVYFISGSSLIATLPVPVDYNDARSNILRRSVICVSLADGEIVRRRWCDDPLYPGWDLNYDMRFFDNNELDKILELLPTRVLENELLARSIHPHYG